MSAPATEPVDTSSSPPDVRPCAWPLWATVAGVLGVVTTIVTDRRAGDPDDPDYTVTVADMAALDHGMYRLGGLSGYLCVLALVVLAAVWHRRVAQRFTWSLGAPIVTWGVVATAATLTLASGWKGALGNYLHGAMEEGTYDDQGLYVYYVMNDFSPYVAWLPVTAALGGLAWMAFRERLVSRGLGAFAGFFAVLIVAAVAVTGVPGLPFAGAFVLAVVGGWLSFGRSSITREVAP
jgi:hypothetical protein